MATSPIRTEAWEGILPGVSQLRGQTQFAGQAQFGQTGPDMFGNFFQKLQQVKSELERKDEAGKPLYSAEEKSGILKGFSSGMPTASDQATYGILNRVLERDTPEAQERLLEMADKYQTKKGWKSFMFNSLNQGVGDLTRGIAMSMNPYGTPEAARYAADMVASSGDRLAAAYAAVRNPMNIPAVQAGQASTYF